MESLLKNIEKKFSNNSLVLDCKKLFEFANSFTSKVEIQAFNIEKDSNNLYGKYDFNGELIFCLQLKNGNVISFYIEDFEIISIYCDRWKFTHETVCVNIDNSYYNTYEYAKVSNEHLEKGIEYLNEILSLL